MLKSLQVVVEVGVWVGGDFSVSHRPLIGSLNLLGSGGLGTKDLGPGLDKSPNTFIL